MATASSLILRGLVMIGAKPLGATLTTAEQTDYLAALNAMLDSWSLERLMVYQLLEETQALTSGVGSLTIGSGGTFNTTRPTKIVDPCFVRDANNIDYHIELINAEAYGRIINKTITGTYPRYMFYDSAWVAGLGTLYLWPEPNAGLTLHINSWKQITQFSSISSTLSLPPGYELAIASNFAIHAAAGFRPVPQETALIARQSKAAIKSVNLPDTMMRLDAGVVRRNTGMSNIYTGF